MPTSHTHSAIYAQSAHYDWLYGTFLIRKTAQERNWVLNGSELRIRVRGAHSAHSAYNTHYACLLKLRTQQTHWPDFSRLRVTITSILHLKRARIRTQLTPQTCVHSAYYAHSRCLHNKQIPLDVFRVHITIVSILRTKCAFAIHDMQDCETKIRTQ